MKSYKDYIFPEFATIHKASIQDVSVAPDHMFVEASTIGLPPGEWPDFVVVVDTDACTLKVFFRSYNFRDNEYEIAGFEYQDVENERYHLTIYND